MTALCARVIACVVFTGGVLLGGSVSAASVTEVVGRGVQIYTCVAADAAPAWRLKAPEAVLLDASGREVGRHFAGPSWRAADGSTVVGEVVASSGSDSGSIPWLVLRAKAHEGAGLFAAVAMIVRTHTAGGVAPPRGCDAGAETRVDYSATYTFFPG